MGLKDLKSNLDLQGGFGNEGAPLGEMDNFTPQNFQLPTDAASQKHIDSLGEVPGGSQNSPHQDLNIDVTTETPAAFQRPTDVADQVHKSSLSLVPGGDSNSPYQDLDGEQGPQFQRDMAAADQFHKDSLRQGYQYQHGDESAEVNATILDLDGLPGPQFQQETDIASQAHISSLASVPGGNSNSPFQDRNDGATPGQYLNNLPN